MTPITAYIAEVRGRIKAFRDVYPVSYANRTEYEDLKKLTTALELAVEALGRISSIEVMWTDDQGIRRFSESDASRYAQQALTQIEQVLKCTKD